MTSTFPIYILDLSGVDHVVHPDGLLDVPHADFWKATVAAIVATHFGLSVKRLLNLPYCQRRARIVVRDDEAVAYYGERQSKKLLKLIAKSVGLPHLEWRSDEHEQRLELDVAEFERLVESSGSRCVLSSLSRATTWQKTPIYQWHCLPSVSFQEEMRLRPLWHCTPEALPATAPRFQKVTR